MRSKAKWEIEDLSLPEPATETDLRRGLRLLMPEAGRAAVDEGLDLTYIVGLYPAVLDANMILGEALRRHRLLVDSKFSNARTAYLFGQAEILRDSIYSLGVEGATPMLRFGYFRQDDRSVDHILSKDTEIRRATTQRRKTGLKAPTKYSTPLGGLILFAWRFSMLSQLPDFVFSEQLINNAYQNLTYDFEDRQTYRKLLKLGVNALQHADELLGRADG